MGGGTCPLRGVTAHFASSRSRHARTTRTRTFIHAARGAEPVESGHAG